MASAESAPRGPAAIILGAGRGSRGGSPTALVSIDKDSRVLDWILQGFSFLENLDVTFVAGYRAEEIAAKYPEIRTSINTNWRRTGPAASLRSAPLERGRTTWIAYSDIVFRPDAVARLNTIEAGIAVAVDSKWRFRYDGRSREAMLRAERVVVDGDRVIAIGPEVTETNATAEFAGLVKLSGVAIDLLDDSLNSGALAPTATLPAIIAHLLASGLRANAVDLEGDWAELDAKQDLARFILGTKAESLERLSPMSHGGSIGDIKRISVSDWDLNPEDCIDQALQAIPAELLIVRSSAETEDSWIDSAAGVHTSVLNVAGEREPLKSAINEVFASYRIRSPDDHVFVQKMLTDVNMSGVVMTRTHSIGAPYYVVNYDDVSNRTDAATAGTEVKTLWVHRASVQNIGDPELRRVIDVVSKIEGLVGHDSLDIEFAVSGTTVHILQVRPIVLRDIPATVDDDEVAQFLLEAESELLQLDACPSNLLGAHLHLSVMTDWNPAEIIGVTPKRLASSMYRFLVMDDVWAQQRFEYGYRDVRPQSLMVEIAGHPYVDVRASFTSFIPDALQDDLGEKLVNAYLGRLSLFPALHDKAEFEILFTCLTTDFASRTLWLKAAGISEEETALLQAALSEITAKGIARLEPDLAEMEDFEAKTDQILGLANEGLDSAISLLNHARQSGTPIFAHLARSAFVATAILDSLVRSMAITADQRDQFLGSIATVLTDLKTDAWRVRIGEIDFETLVAKYGHLRPGTYDITAPCYASAPDLYFGPIVQNSLEPSTESDFAWDSATEERVERALLTSGINLTARGFLKFAVGAIAGRERSKFAFTKALSNALEGFADYGDRIGLNRDDLAHIDLSDLMNIGEHKQDPFDYLLRRSGEGQDAHIFARSICLPSQISSSAQIRCFTQDAAEPNFVTTKKVQGRVVVAPDDPSVDIRGVIVLIANADPGFDWMLARGIGGLVTCYGGSNSHMAVRAAELGIPAAIGVGSAKFEALLEASAIQLDCESRSIDRIMS
ncbi:MAG: PEP-utilizing enzyme [Actinomycetes bacterium]